VWTCACLNREAGEETVGFAAKRLRTAQGHTACDLARLRASTVVFWKGGVVHETADLSLAERIQNLGRLSEGEHGLLPLFGTPLSDVCVPLQVLRDKKFREKYLTQWADDERILMDLANAHLTTSAPATDECEACMSCMRTVLGRPVRVVCSSNDTEPSGEPQGRQLGCVKG